MRRSPLLIISIIVLFSSISSFSREVMSWIPSYAVNACKNVCNSDVPIENGLTTIGLQFWVPTSSGGVNWSKHGADASDVEWFRNWAHSNEIKVFLCIYNGDDGWDWPLARGAFSNNKSSFISNLVSTMEEYNLDGIDVDLEGTRDYSSDRPAFAAFIKELREAMPKDKMLTIDSFHSPCYNTPSMAWWDDWIGYVDNIHSMGYGELYEGNWTAYEDCPQAPETVGDTYFKFSYHQQFAMDLGYKPSVVSVGFPGGGSSWGGQNVTAHLDDILSMTNPVSVCIWDFQFGGNSYNSSSTWDKFKTLKEYGGYGDTTTTPIDTSGWGKNYLEEVEWLLSHEHGSSSIDTSNLHQAEGYISGNFNLDQMDDPNKIYPWGQISASLKGGDLDSMDSIIVTYKSDVSFSVTLDQDNLVASGAYYRATVSPSSEWKSKVLRFNAFKQPSWTKTEDVKNISLSTSKAISFLSEADNQTSNIQIKAIYLPGFTGFPVPIVLNNNIKNYYNRIRSINKNKVLLSVAKAGTYNLNVYSVNGKLISSTSQNLKKAGSHTLDIKGINSRGLYIIRFMGEDISLEEKLLVK